jgi:hypothetical protein
MKDDIEKQLEEIEAMFVQTAREMLAGEGSVKLRGLSPATLFFSDRPEHVVLRAVRATSGYVVEGPPGHEEPLGPLLAVPGVRIGGPAGPHVGPGVPVLAVVEDVQVPVVKLVASLLI